MNVRELIKELSSYNLDMRVVVHGYEGGCADLTTDRIYPTLIALNENESKYFGPHEYNVSNDGYYEHTETALMLDRP